ncbi:MAG: type I methionyl aminopeptidase [Lentisphaeria bacterium]|jgi:methionyl aminopeptidase
MAKSGRVIIHTPGEIAAIRVAARATAAVRDELARLAAPGMTTGELDQLAGALIRATGGESAFLGYHGYPGQICISVNDEVVHGIGHAGRRLRPGDLLSLDIGVRLGGGIGDTALTIAVGGTPPSPEAARLLEVTEASLYAGIRAARGGRAVSEIGAAVEAVVAAAGMHVVRDFVGHGCGTQLHEPPEIPNFATRSRGPKLQPGMVLAIEPMVNLGTHQVSVDAGDGWTVRTADGSLSAHFEHLILITDGNPEILTCPKTPSASKG